MSDRLNASPPENRRNADIECLRAIAVVMVLVHHARETLFVWPKPLWDHITDNYFTLWPSVDLFFAISGFVIAKNLLPPLRRCNGPQEFIQAVLAFWVRRVWRLLPSAWLWLAIMLIGTVFFNRTGEFGSFKANFDSTIAGLLSVANVRIGTFVNPLKGGNGISTHYWTLSLEEQFYFVLPIIIYLARRWLTVVIFLSVLIVFLLPQTTLLMAFRVHAMLLGVLLAIFSEQPAYALFEPVILARRPGVSFAILTLLLALISALGVFMEQITPHNVDVIAVLCALMVLIASYDRDYLCSNVVLKRVMDWLGSRSFALYLCHLFVYVGTRELWFRLSPPGTHFGATYTLRFALTALTLLALFAEANYQLVERPLRRYGKQVAERLAVRRPGAASPAPAESKMHTTRDQLASPGFDQAATEQC